jgi:hypothetical protein
MEAFILMVNDALSFRGRISVSSLIDGGSPRTLKACAGLRLAEVAI